MRPADLRKHGLHSYANTVVASLSGGSKSRGTPNWYVPYYVDVGTGDSDLTWQGLAGLGYNFSSVDVTAAWRYLDYDFGSRTPVQSINFNGPAIGVAFRF